MPSFWERFRNLGTDELSRPGDAISDTQRREIERQVARDLQERIVGSSFELRTAWTQEVPMLQRQKEYDFLAASNRGLLEGLNTTLSHLQHVDPDIQMRFQPDQFEAEARASWDQAKEVRQTDLERQQELHQSELKQGQLSGLSADALLTPDSLREQAQAIVEEWRHDLAEPGQDPHDVQLYFAGRIDQHNALIEQAANAQPKLVQSLPQQINFVALKNELEQEQAERKEPSQDVSQAAFGFGI